MRLLRYSTLAATLVALATASLALAGSIDVTANPTIQADLQRAVQFWQALRPDLTSPCAAERVIVTRMLPGSGNNGQSIPIAAIWAQTDLRGCTISLSQFAWHEIRTAPRVGGRYGVCMIIWQKSGGYCSTMAYSQWNVCNRIAHEYAHTLGLDDTAHGLKILNQTVTGGDYVCDRAYGR